MIRVAPTAVYLLCLATSISCAALLLRAWIASRTRLLLWTAVCFILLAANNAVLVADMVLFPEVDLAALRQLTTAAALCVLLYGFIWETD